MSIILALDEGTTSARALVFDHTGKLLSLAQQPISQSYPHPGWVEQDASIIWDTQLQVALSALQQSGKRLNEIAAIGITNQRETTVVWDRKSGQPIYPAIVWQDRRTANHCEQLKQLGHEKEVRTKTGLLLDPYFSATKIAWILDNVSGARARAENGELAFGTIDSWLIWLS